MGYQLMHLNLRSPLFYTRVKDLPREMSEDEEFLLFYELDSVQSRSIEPEKELLLGSLVFTGRRNNAETGSNDDLKLPAGNYLFVQYRGPVLSCEEWLEMAIEQQKDGLWERYKLKNELYVRFLFEDGSFVTQLFRPCF